MPGLDDGGIWGPDGEGGLALLARSLEPLPDDPSGASFSSFENPVLLESGEVVFLSRARDPERTFPEVLFLADAGAGLTELLRTGDLLELGAGDRAA